MNYVKFPERGIAKSDHAGIESESAMSEPRGEVDSFDSVFDEPPASGGFLRSYICSNPLGRTEVNGENRNTVSALCQFSREYTDLYGTATFGEIREVGLGHIEDSH